jgi:uncharacterized membrane protein
MLPADRIDSEFAMTQIAIEDAPLHSLKQTARLLYLGHAVAFLFSAGLLNLAILIINYLVRQDAQGSFVYSHHSWMIRSYWYYLLIGGIGWLCILSVIGLPLGLLLVAGALLFEAYRLIRGFIELNNNRPMP